MKLYLITDASGRYEHKDIVLAGEGKKVWAGTQADARKARIDFETYWKELPSSKRPKVTVDEVDVPTSKTELLAWLNENAV